MFFSGLTTQKPVGISNDDGESDEDFHTAPRDPVGQDREHPPRALRMARVGSLPNINMWGGSSGTRTHRH